MTAVFAPTKISPVSGSSRPLLIRAFEVAPADAAPAGNEAGKRAGLCVRALIARAPVESPAREYQQAVCRHLLHLNLSHEPFSSGPTGSGRPWALGKTASGVPVLTGGPAARHCSVSMSHSGPWAMVAVAAGAGVGVDIERGRANMDVAAMAAYLGWKKEVASRDDFLARWTLWEASVKLEGSTIFKPSAAAFEALKECSGTDGIATADRWAAVRGRACGQAHFALVLELPAQQSLKLEDIREDFTSADLTGRNAG